MPAPGPEMAVALCSGLRKGGLASTIGYFGGPGGGPEQVLEAYAAAIDALSAQPHDTYLSVKAPQLEFSETRLRALAETAASARLPLLFDAHGPDLADRTLDLAESLLGAFPGTGLVLPARWRRSRADAERFRDGSARIRVVKGEWADPAAEDGDTDADYLALIAALAGRAATVSVATHKPALASRALAMLTDASTPCELEQLRGLPRKRTSSIARTLGVPVRVYIPFGPGWYPYAIDKALGRPYLPLWLARDWLGLPDG